MFNKVSQRKLKNSSSIIIYVCFSDVEVVKIEKVVSNQIEKLI